jgi:hypothetical protein
MGKVQKTTNPNHYIYNLSQCVPKVCGVTNDYIVGMKHDKHMKQVLLGIVLWREGGKKLRAQRIQGDADDDNVIFQQYVTPAQYANIVREFLDATFPRR